MVYGGGMGTGCLTGIRFNMQAEILTQVDKNPDQVDIDKYGEWVESQDPVTLELIRIWKAGSEIIDPDNPDIIPKAKTIPCLARGIVDGGIRVAGTTERFSDIYENIDYVKLWIPAHVVLTKRDRVTNIRDASGHVRWLDEEYAGPGKPARATVFNVNGVTPLFDAFNNIVEQFVLLEKAEVDGVE